MFGPGGAAAPGLGGLIAENQMLLGQLSVLAVDSRGRITRGSRMRLPLSVSCLACEGLLDRASVAL